jgi:hypothetical protein
MHQCQEREYRDLNQPVVDVMLKLISKTIYQISQSFDWLRVILFRVINFHIMISADRDTKMPI